MENLGPFAIYWLELSLLSGCRCELGPTGWRFVGPGQRPEESGVRADLVQHLLDDGSIEVREGALALTQAALKRHADAMRVPYPSRFEPREESDAVQSS